jgi:undecaprenyl-diphosphatase
MSIGGGIRRIMMDFVELLKAVLLGIVQGITEWLPVSSTGHMILLDELLPLQVSSAFKELFFVVVQLGSILAVLVLYFHKLNPFSSTKTAVERKQTWLLWAKVLVASIPVGVVGILFDDWINKTFFRWQVIVAALALYGVLYIVLERRRKGTAPRIATLEDLSWKDAFGIGLFQTLAVVPGTSRSGSTILGGIILGVDRAVAAEFSFFLALPAMAGASLIKIVKIGLGFSALEWAVLAIGCLSAFMVSLIAIKFLVGYVRRHDFSVFGWYRIALAAVVTIFFLATGH